MAKLYADTPIQIQKKEIYRKYTDDELRIVVHGQQKSLDFYTFDEPMLHPVLLRFIIPTDILREPEEIIVEHEDVEIPDEENCIEIEIGGETHYIHLITGEVLDTIPTKTVSRPTAAYLARLLMDDKSVYKCAFIVSKEITISELRIKLSLLDTREKKVAFAIFCKTEQLHEDTATLESFKVGNHMLELSLRATPFYLHVVCTEMAKEWTITSQLLLQQSYLVQQLINLISSFAGVDPSSISLLSPLGQLMHHEDSLQTYHIVSSSIVRAVYKRKVYKPHYHNIPSCTIYRSLLSSKVDIQTRHQILDRCLCLGGTKRRHFETNGTEIRSTSYTENSSSRTSMACAKSRTIEWKCVCLSQWKQIEASEYQNYSLCMTCCIIPSRTIHINNKEKEAIKKRKYDLLKGNLSTNEDFNRSSDENVNDVCHKCGDVVSTYKLMVEQKSECLDDDNVHLVTQESIPYHLKTSHDFRMEAIERNRIKQQRKHDKVFDPLNTDIVKRYRLLLAAYIRGLHHLNLGDQMRILEKANELLSCQASRMNGRNFVEQSRARDMGAYIYIAAKIERITLTLSQVISIVPAFLECDDHILTWAKQKTLAKVIRSMLWSRVCKFAKKINATDKEYVLIEEVEEKKEEESIYIDTSIQENRIEIEEEKVEEEKEVALVELIALDMTLEEMAPILQLILVKLEAVAEGDHKMRNMLLRSCQTTFAGIEEINMVCNQFQKFEGFAAGLIAFFFCSSGHKLKNIRTKETITLLDYAKAVDVSLKTLHEIKRRLTLIKI